MPPPANNRPQKIIFAGMRAQGVRGLLIYCADFNAAARVAAAWTLLEENERTPAGNNMPQVPGLPY
jgi:hypothetical protein